MHRQIGNRDQGYGTYITWNSYGPDRDPLEVKNNSWDECAAVRQWLFEMVGEVSGLRHYPFIALRANTSDLVELCEFGEESTADRMARIA